MKHRVNTRAEYGTCLTGIPNVEHLLIQNQGKESYSLLKHIWEADQQRWYLRNQKQMEPSDGVHRSVLG